MNKADAALWYLTARAALDAGPVVHQTMLEAARLGGFAVAVAVEPPGYLAGGGVNPDGGPAVCPRCGTRLVLEEIGYTRQWTCLERHKSVTHVDCDEWMYEDTVPHALVCYGSTDGKYCDYVYVPDFDGEGFEWR